MTDSTHHIVGKITELKTKPNPLNFNRTSITKMIVTDLDGTRYQGTRPSGVAHAEMGDRIKFTAEIQRSSKQNKLFFFRDARNAQVVAP